MHDLLYYSELSLLLEGWAFNLKNSNIFGIKRGLQPLNPYTMQSQYQKGELRFWQQLPTGERFPGNGGYWTVDDFLYFREFNPMDDLGQGISATHVAINDAQIISTVTKFLGNFFGADALPVTLVTLPPGTMADERDRVQNWFKDKLTKLRKAVARVLAVTGDVKLEKLTSELKSFEFEKIDTHALDAVAQAFQIPKSLLDSSADSYATAEVASRSFLVDTVIPRAMYFQEVINDFLQEFDQRIEFTPEEMTEMQEDESLRADALLKLTNAGLPLQVALGTLGYDFSEENQKILDKHFAELNKPKPVPKQVVDPQGNLVTLPTNGNGAIPNA